ncbi:MAG: hypothetical protein AMJ79_03465 [Phycisphaerae bacterium SM23_30]|nr:MAG: hypothetical protein AMJ79_03465 [Phycisphaerae bacterium SM23_30]
MLAGLICAAVAQQRFPPPDFGPDYQMPETTTPPPQAIWYDLTDLAVLVTALVVASYLTLKNRNRNYIFLLMVFSLVYFGFWRQGCVCPIGAIQNITLALFDSSYSIPLVALAFFVLPLAFTLFFGRGFCAAVCPLGAIQDVVLLHPLRVPLWLQQALGLLAYVYLAAAVLFAATGSAFIICEYDPFVSFFRLSGGINMLVLGGSLLLIGIFVGRPYCRFLCPYGVLLRLMSRLSKWRGTITPRQCVQCRLCEDTCPFGAIDIPTPQTPDAVRTPDRVRLAALLMLLPIIMLFGGFLVSHLSTPFSRMHADVRLAERIYLEETGQVEDTVDESDAFRATGNPPEMLYQQARSIHDQFIRGGWILGAFLGLVVVGKLIRLSVFRRQSDYQAHRAYCLACGRCFASCPVHLQTLKDKEVITTIKQ